MQLSKLRISGDKARLSTEVTCDMYDAYEFTIKYNVDREPLFFQKLALLFWFGLFCLLVFLQFRKLNPNYLLKKK